MYNYYAIDLKTDEVQHYGVKGMKWGVIHNTKKVIKAAKKYNANKNADTLYTLGKAVYKTNKTKAKIVKASNKNSKRLTKYATKKASLNKKYGNRVSKYTIQSAKYTNKAYRTSNQRKYNKYMAKKNKADYKLNKIKSKTVKTDSKYDTASFLDKTYNMYLSEINQTYAKVGEKLINTALNEYMKE